MENTKENFVNILTEPLFPDGVTCENFEKIYRALKTFGLEPNFACYDGSKERFWGTAGHNGDEFHFTAFIFEEQIVLDSLQNITFCD